MRVLVICPACGSRVYWKSAADADQRDRCLCCSAPLRVRVDTPAEESCPLTDAEQAIAARLIWDALGEGR